LVLVLHARAKRVVLLYISMVRRSACCAPEVMLQPATQHNSTHQYCSSRSVGQPTRTLATGELASVIAAAVRRPAMAAAAAATDADNAAAVLCHAVALAPLPICLIQDDYLVSAGWQRDLFLCKHLDLIAHNINSSARTNASSSSRLQKTSGA
jgi:hypothetical protein